MIFVNGWAVIAAVAANFILGGVWYSPALFMKPWLQMSGVNKSRFDAGLPRALLGDFASSLLMAIVLAHLIRFSGATGLSQGLLTAFGIWLGFIVPVLLGSVTYEQKPIAFFAINAGYRLVAILVMGTIFVLWR